MSHVLIIDDDAGQSAVLAELLRRKGHEARYAASAGQALTYLREHGDPDLVLLDLSMPRTDGLDLLDALTAEPRFENLRIAVYSGRAEPAAFEAARRLGACDFILKGEDWEQTYGRIAAHLDAATPGPDA